MMNLPKSQTGRKDERFRAWQTINEVSIACLVLAVIYVAMGIFEGKLLIVEGLIFGALGILLSREVSRLAAFLLMGISLISFSNGMVSWLGIIEFGERNILLAVVGLWCGARAIQATILLRGSLIMDDLFKRGHSSRKNI